MWPEQILSLGTLSSEGPGPCEGLMSRSLLPEWQGIPCGATWTAKAKTLDFRCRKSSCPPLPQELEWLQVTSLPLHFLFHFGFLRISLNFVEADYAVYPAFLSVS